MEGRYKRGNGIYSYTRVTSTKSSREHKSLSPTGVPQSTERHILKHASMFSILAFQIPGTKRFSPHPTDKNM